MGPALAILGFAAAFTLMSESGFSTSGFHRLVQAITVSPGNPWGTAMLMTTPVQENQSFIASRIGVLVVHDDPLARAGLLASLGAYPDIEVLGAHSASEIGRLPVGGMVRRVPDVIVAAHDCGVAIASRVGSVFTSPGAPKVLIVSSSDREWEIRHAIERGVRGYLLAGCTLDDLAEGVRAVYRGARHFSPQVIQRLAESMSAETLTAREEEVLQLVVIGLCNKAIAKRLDIALGTVKTHLRSTFDKLGVESRTQAVIAVAERGLLRGTGPAIGGHPATQFSVRSDLSRAGSEISV